MMRFKLLLGIVMISLSSFAATVEKDTTAEKGTVKYWDASQNSTGRSLIPKVG
jgi:ABC-type oligopeptide transport system substrate-binding subunit